MSQPKDIDNLLQAYFAGDTSPEVIQAMEAWLREDPRNPRILAEYGLLDRLLGFEQKKLEASAIFGALLESEEAAETIVVDQLDLLHLKADPRPQDSLPLKQAFAEIGSIMLRTIRAHRVAISGVAALLLLAAVAAFVLIGGPDENPIASEEDTNPPDEVLAVATLIGQQDAQWQTTGGPLPSVGDRLTKGQELTLISGFAELTTSRGAVVKLEAPCTVALTGPNEVTLDSGRLVGICHSQASKGFVVRTDHATIVDLGTEFGVHARPGAVTTTVFTGEINLTTPGGEPQKLEASQTARLTVQGNNRELVLDNQLAQGFERLLRPALITDARINLEGFEVRIVPRGVYEDAKIFTDRPHEINGFDASGIPDILRGGDLVMMPANARPDRIPGTRGLKLEVDLAAPADIYLLIQRDREDKLAWLHRDYVRTDLRVGFDRADFADSEAVSNQSEQLGIGPGNDIDEQLIVWKRKSTAAGTVTAGYEIDNTMYCVIVVPKGEGGTEH